MNEGDLLLDDQGGAVPMQLIRPPLVVGGWRRRLSFVAELPPLGYRVYWVQGRLVTPSPSPVATGEGSLAARPSPVATGEGGRG